MYFPVQFSIFIILFSSIFELDAELPCYFSDPYIFMGHILIPACNNVDQRCVKFYENTKGRSYSIHAPLNSTNKITNIHTKCPAGTFFLCLICKKENAQNSKQEIPFEEEKALQIEDNSLEKLENEKNVVKEDISVIKQNSKKMKMSKFPPSSPMSPFENGPPKIVNKIVPMPEQPDKLYEFFCNIKMFFSLILLLICFFGLFYGLLPDSEWLFEPCLHPEYFNQQKWE